MLQCLTERRELYHKFVSLVNGVSQIFETEESMQKGNENKIGERMKELRGDMSQRQAASCVGIMPQNWNVYEKGQSVPGAQVIIDLCRFFNVTSDWLLGLSDVRGAAQVAAPIQSTQSNSDLLAEIRALKTRVSVLESQPAFACG